MFPQLIGIAFTTLLVLAVVSKSVRRHNKKSILKMLNHPEEAINARTPRF